MKTSSLNTQRFAGKGLLPILILFLLSGMAAFSPLYGQSSSLSLALLPFENMNNNPEQDYLKGIISSLLEEDLTSSDALQIVERDSLEEVLKEQKLQMAGLMDDKNALEAGRLLGASYMLKGGFVFLGQDIFINITLIEVETGRTRAFSKRGYQENTVHALSEELIEYMTGNALHFQSPEGERSILALLQQEPGTVELFSYIVDARVYIDEEFVAYTTGDRTVPLVMTVAPGRHTIRLHLSKNFGVIKLPEILFSDWEEEFELLPGEKIILEDKTSHFNGIIYDLQQIIRDELKLKPKEESLLTAEHSGSFVDRDGKTIDIDLQIRWEKTESPEQGGKATVLLVYNGEEHNYEYFSPQGEDLDIEETVEKVKLDMELECRSEWYWDLDYGIWRTDIYQGMHRDEY